MGVHVLEGTYDGTEQAAVMVDSVTGEAFGTIFKGPDAPEKIETFLGWMRTVPFAHRLDDFNFREVDLPRFPVTLEDAGDPRTWPASGLRKLIAFWTKEAVDENGMLKPVVEA